MASFVVINFNLLLISTKNFKAADVVYDVELLLHWKSGGGNNGIAAAKNALSHIP